MFSRILTPMGSSSHLSLVKTNHLITAINHYPYHLILALAHKMHGPYRSVMLGIHVRVSAKTILS